MNCLTPWRTCWTHFWQKPFVIGQYHTRFVAAANQWGWCFPYMPAWADHMIYKVLSIFVMLSENNYQSEGNSMDFADFWLAFPQISHRCTLEWWSLVIIGYEWLWPEWIHYDHVATSHLRPITKLIQPWMMNAKRSCSGYYSGLFCIDQLISVLNWVASSCLDCNTKFAKSALFES